MEHIIGTGIGVCLGLTVYSILVAILIVVASKINRKRRIQELGDAWLQAVDLGLPHKGK